LFHGLDIPNVYHSIQIAKPTYDHIIGVLALNNGISVVAVQFVQRLSKFAVENSERGHEPTNDYKLVIIDKFKRVDWSLI